MKRNQTRKNKRQTKGTTQRPRLAVFRSHKAIYAQIIDDQQGKTLVAASGKDLLKKDAKDKKLVKTQKAKMVGEILAQKAIKKKIKKVVFDRRRYRYHGRVRALAEGARKGGLEF